MTNIKGFLQGNYRLLADQFEFIKPPEHIKEQAIWRLEEVKRKSPECYENGACQFCGCDIDGKVMEDRACEEGCYPIMMTAKEWTIFKEINKIELT